LRPQADYGLRSGGLSPSLEAGVSFAQPSVKVWKVTMCDHPSEIPAVSW
jgi:hypothetical protein